LKKELIFSQKEKAIMSCDECEQHFVDGENVVLMITDMPAFLAGGCSWKMVDGKCVVDPTTYQPPAYELEFLCVWSSEKQGCITSKYPDVVFGGDKSPVCDIVIHLECREEMKKDEITLGNGQTVVIRGL